MNYGNFMQNFMRITVTWLNSKPEEEFQYGGRLFLQNGNSYISAVDWDILTIFGVLIDIYLLEKVTSPSPKPEVKLHHSGRHLKQELSYRKQIARQLRTQYVEGILCLITYDLEI